MPEILTNKALNRALLARQMLLSREHIPVNTAVERLSGMQAQQPKPPFVGLWTRLIDFQREQLIAALRDHSIVRATWIRGTIHLVTAGDYLRFRTTLQPMLSAGMKAILRERAASLDPGAILAAAHACYASETAVTFAALRDRLLESFPAADERAMGYFVRMQLPLVLVPDDSYWGFSAAAPFTPSVRWLGQEPDERDQIQELVRRYLAAFGPATAADMQAWSGLAKMQPVLAAMRSELVVFQDHRKRELFDLPIAPRPDPETPAPVRFLPGFDNIILGHADRTRIIAEEHRPSVVTKNLQVLPVFLVDGFVAGLWTVKVQKKTATLTIEPFETIPAKARKELIAEGEKLARFVEPEATQSQVSFT